MVSDGGQEGFEGALEVGLGEVVHQPPREQSHCLKLGLMGVPEEVGLVSPLRPSQLPLVRLICNVNPFNIVPRRVECCGTY